VLRKRTPNPVVNEVVIPSHNPCLISVLSVAIKSLRHKIPCHSTLDERPSAVSCFSHVRAFAPNRFAGHSESA
jgi:hypothetical protein